MKMENNFSEMSRKMYCDAILQFDAERTTCDPGREAYKAYSKLIEHCHRSLECLRDPDKATFTPSHRYHTET